MTYINTFKHLYTANFAVLAWCTHNTISSTLHHLTDASTLIFVHKCFILTVLSYNSLL